MYPMYSLCFKETQRKEELFCHSPNKSNRNQTPEETELSLNLLGGVISADVLVVQECTISSFVLPPCEAVSSTYAGFALCGLNHPICSREVPFHLPCRRTGLVGPVSSRGARKADHSVTLSMPWLLFHTYHTDDRFCAGMHDTTHNRL